MIQINQVTKTFKKSVVAIEDISFSVGKGEVVGLLGENGAGKTTTLRMIATVMKPTSGFIQVDRLDTVKRSKQVKRKIGILFGGETGLYDRLTAKENIEYLASLYELGEKDTQEEIKKLADIFNMHEYMDRRVGGFSKGMRQKVAIARSIIHNPEVILFDEPTSGLDVIAANEMRLLIEHFIKQDKTVIFSSHIMSEVEKLCDRILILHKGKLRYDGMISSLYDRYGHRDLDQIFMSEVGVDLRVQTS